MAPITSSLLNTQLRISSRIIAPRDKLRSQASQQPAGKLGAPGEYENDAQEPEQMLGNVFQKFLLNYDYGSTQQAIQNLGNQVGTRPKTQEKNTRAPNNLMRKHIASIAAAKRFSVTKLDSENTAGIPTNFDEDCNAIASWQPTLQNRGSTRKRGGSSSFNIQKGRMSNKSYFVKAMKDLSDSLSPTLS